jgi:tripartite-type tricarboxylate transporter receptor subunit TctC
MDGTGSVDACRAPLGILLPGNRAGIPIADSEELMSGFLPGVRRWMMAVPLLALVSVAWAQDYPTRPIRLIASNSPGTLVDTVARVFAPEFSRFVGQPVIVENRQGAANTIGYDFVAKSAPDGYTIGTAVASELATYPVTIKELRFDPLRDLPNLMGLVESRLVMVTSTSHPWKSFGELVANARANPGKLNYGSSSALTRLLAESVIQGQSLNIVDIPYSGGGPMIQSILSGQVHMGFVGESTALANPEKMRVLAATGDRRKPPFLDVPTFRELGHPQVPGLYVFMVGPVGIPKSAVEKIVSASARALQVPEVKARFAKLSVEVVDESPDAAARRLPEEARSYAEIAKKIGMQPQ